MPTLGGGGAERTVITLARGMADRGHSVWLLVASANGTLSGEIPKNVALIDLCCGRVIKAMRPLARWLRISRPDILVSTQGHANVVAYIGARTANMDCRLLMREVSTPSINLRHLKGLRKWAYRALLRYVYRRAGAVVAVSNGAGNDLQEYLSCQLPNIHVIYNPVIASEIRTRALEPIEHSWFKPDAKIPVVLAVGRLTAAKNYSFLLRSFAQVVREKEARLLILGEGDERADLEKLIHQLGLNEVVDLPGFDVNPFKYMASSALYVMSSNWEGLPGALIQAVMLCPRVISTDCPSGPREILKEGKFGELVPPNDVARMTQEILKALNDEIKREANLEMEEWLKRFSQPRVISEYETIFNQLMTRCDVVRSK